MLDQWNVWVCVCLLFRTNLWKSSLPDDDQSDWPTHVAGRNKSEHTKTSDGWVHGYYCWWSVCTTRACPNKFNIYLACFGQAEPSSARTCKVLSKNYFCFTINIIVFSQLAHYRAQLYISILIHINVPVLQSPSRLFFVNSRMNQRCITLLDYRDEAPLT